VGANDTALAHGNRDHHSGNRRGSLAFRSGGFVMVAYLRFWTTDEDIVGRAQGPTNAVAREARRLVKAGYSVDTGLVLRFDDWFKWMKDEQAFHNQHTYALKG
jgi:hypothetical protein